MADPKAKKKSLWEQMGRKVPAMVTEDMTIPKKEVPEEEKPKDKSLWEKMGRKPLFGK